MKTNAVAIIPARGGSKRIPRKNIKDFFGKPLIAYSIEVAKASGLFDKIIVSTDDEEIAKIAQEYGAEVPFMRPKELSDDFSTSLDVMEHAVETLKKNGEEINYACLLYATAPLLSKEYLEEGFLKLKESDASVVFSATAMSFPIQRTFKLTTDGRCEMFMPEYENTRSQDLEESYQDAGQFYFYNLQRPLNGSIFASESIPLILPSHLVVDIDTPDDWTRAEVMYEILQRSK